MMRGWRIRPAVATHHPLRRLESAWLDEQSVKNASEALDILKPIADQTAVISGHVHQESDELVSGVRMMTTRRLACNLHRALKTLRSTVRSGLSTSCSPKCSY